MKLYFNISVYLSCFIFVVISSCTKEEITQKSTTKTTTTSDTPSIAFVSLTPSAAKQYTDQVTLTISYKDGNGDLGENNPDVKNLFVTDSRNKVEYKYRISQLAPDTTIAIQGNLNIQLNTVAILDTNNVSETLTYNIYVTDRAGNQSNTVTSSVLTVTK